MALAGPSRVAHVEALCTAMYTDADAGNRRQAEEELRANAMMDLDLLLECLIATENAYAGMFCCLSLLPAFKSKAAEPRVHYDGIFDALIAKVIAMHAAPPDSNMRIVAKLMLSTISRMNKMTMEHEGLSCVIDRVVAAVPVTADLTSAPPEAAVYLRLLAELVNDAQLYDASKAQSFMNFSAHRRASQALRDGPLKDVFQYALQLLRNIQSVGRGASVDDAIVGAVCELVRYVLTYDYMAIIVDETEELFVTQFPSDWKDVLNEEALRLVGWAHHELPMPHCLTMLRGLIGLIGTRKSFFDSDEMRMAWLDFFMSQLLSVESSTDGRLSSPDYAAALADSIQRFTPPYTYRDLVGCASSQQWFTSAANFTMTMFQIPFGDGGSFATTTTLMGFWSRIVGSKRIAMSDTPAPGSDIEDFVPLMVQAFVKTRVTTVDVSVDEDALDSINSQSDLLPGMITLCPNECLGPVCQDLAALGTAAVSRAPSTMIWVCSIAASLLKHWYPNVRDDHVHVAGLFLDFASGCVATFQNTQARNDGAIENAIVHFLSQLHQVFSSSRLAAPLDKMVKDVFGDRNALFQFILNSVGSNMLSTVLEPATIAASIEVIVEACKELPSEMLLAINFELPPIESLPFSQSHTTYKLRTQLSKALYTLRVPGSFYVERFSAFMDSTEALMRGAQPAPLYTAGWLRDLRGVAAGASCATVAFTEFLDWLTQRNDVFCVIARTPNLPPEIVISYLKLLQQLVTPCYPSGRVSVGSMTHSAAGIYLFQFVAEKVQLLMQHSVITAEATVALAAGHTHADIWYQTLKPLAISMEICRRCVSGEFCPFGAMALYGDTRFDETVAGVVSFARQIPPHFFKEYVKLGSALAFLLRTLNEASTITPFAAMTVDDLRFLIARALQVGTDVDEKTAVASNALSFLSLIGGLFPEVLRLRNNGPSPHSANSPSRSTRAAREQIARHLVNEVGLWDDLVLAAMQVVTQQDRGLSNAGNTVFPIFEADPSRWTMYREYLLTTYPPAKQARVAELLEQLGNGVSSADAFFTNLVQFRMAIRMV